MRLPYAPSSPPAPTSPDDQTAAIYQRIAERRKPRPLIPLDLTLLHSPPVADGWNHFIGALRTQTVLDQALLELSVCRVAVLNGAIYEWNAHAPLALKAGLSREGLEACRTLGEGEEASEGSGLDEIGRAVLSYTDQMTKGVTVAGELFDVLKRLFTEREIVELTACVGAYNCVSRFLVALDVGENNAKEMKSVAEVVEDLERSAKKS